MNSYVLVVLIICITVVICFTIAFLVNKDDDKDVRIRDIERDLTSLRSAAMSHNSYTESLLERIIGIVEVKRK